ncbi:hypothetical protein C0Q70_02675 [Pomacea canaliculata]|uniref:Sodium-dependent phosphate transport protein 2B n=1 Tax=Pomacea canaliculata TaxID=400727 RepID=A0A2T7PQK6_POMCA|nr:hypothetical protein C0Q70_02675 [Pomacea canaliculata]
MYDHGADHNNHPETRGHNGLDQTRNRDIHGRTDPTAVAMLEDQDDEGCVIECLSENGHGYGYGFLLPADRLPAPNTSSTAFCNGHQPNDSGFSSRIWEDPAAFTQREVQIEELNKAVAIVARGDDPDNDDGSVFHDSELFHNPITGLMIGVLATVILQSSSTSTSIAITMVSSGIIEVRPAIPIIMGANIGTTVTNTLVSLAHSMDPKEFRRAFSGATVHDVFNWLTVLILLPLEYFAGYLYHLTTQIVQSLNLENLHTQNQDLLKKLTKPLTQRIVTVDENIITEIAEGKMDPAKARLLKVVCKYGTEVVQTLKNETGDGGNVTFSNHTRKFPLENSGQSLFALLDWSDSVSGSVLFLISIFLLSICLYLMVKMLHSMLGGHLARAAKHIINADFPYPFSCLTGYVALLVGAGMTILVQSSSVFTSALTPLVGVGCLKLERMYPLTLGSNIGTTATGILAALASSGSTMRFALQIALCHLFFNVSGILLFYPVPCMRRIPLRAARFLGHTTARYRWFAAFYLIMMFLVLPGCFLALSFSGNITFITVLVLLALLSLVVVVLNLLQKSRFRSKLPRQLQTWSWLPLWLRSLEPLDRLLRWLFSPLERICCACCMRKCHCLSHRATRSEIDSDDEDNDASTTSSDEGEDDESYGCCCLRKTGQQSDSSLREIQSSSVWNKRTLSPKEPIYRPVGKPDKGMGNPVHSRTPLITSPESIV